MTMTDNQKKLAAIIEAKLKEAIEPTVFELEKRFDEQACDDDTRESLEAFYSMQYRFEKQMKQHARAIAHRADATTTDHLIDTLTETSS